MTWLENAIYETDQARVVRILRVDTESGSMVIVEPPVALDEADGPLVNQHEYDLEGEPVKADSPGRLMRRVKEGPYR